MARSLYNITTLSYTVLTTLLYKCHKNLSYEYLNCILPGHQWHVLRKRYFLVHKKSRLRGFSFEVIYLLSGSAFSTFFISFSGRLNRSTPCSNFNLRALIYDTQFIVFGYKYFR